MLEIFVYIFVLNHCGEYSDRFIWLVGCHDLSLMLQLNFFIEIIMNNDFIFIKLFFQVP